MTESPSRSGMLKLVTRLFTPIALLFLLTLLWQSRDILATTFANVRGGWLALSVLCWMSLYALAPWFTVRVLKGLGREESYRALLHIFIARLPAKYLPGGIWQTVARAYDLKNRGTDSGQLTRLLAYELGMPVVAAFTVGALLLTLSGVARPALQMPLMLVAGLGMAGMLLGPLAHRWRLLRLGPIDANCYWQSILIITVYWLLAGLSFAAFIMALGLDDAINNLWSLAGAYGFSWGVGYLAIFAPQGLGVLEYTAQQMINLPLDTAAGISVIFCFRALVVCLDLLAWATLVASGLLQRVAGEH